MRGVLINRVHCYGCTVCTLLNPSKIWYGGMVLEHILSNSGLLYLSLAFLGYPTEGLSGIRKNVFLKSELNWTFEVYIVCIMTGRVVCSTVVTTYQVGGWPIFSWLTCHDIQWHILRGEGGGGGGGVIIGWACHALLAAVELPTILREVFTITKKVPNRNFSWLKAPNY